MYSRDAFLMRKIYTIFFSVHLEFFVSICYYIYNKPSDALKSVYSALHKYLLKAVSSKYIS